MAEIRKAEGGGVHRDVRDQRKQTNWNYEDHASRQDLHNVSVEYMLEAEAEGEEGSE